MENPGEVCFLTNKNIERIKDFYDDDVGEFDLNKLNKNFKRLNIKSINDLNNYINSYFNFTYFIKQLIQSLEQDKIITKSKRNPEFYYSLTGDKVKGMKGTFKAQQYIFNNHIINSYQYQNLLQYNKKNLEYYGWDIFELGSELIYFESLTSFCMYEYEN